MRLLRQDRPRTRTPLKAAFAAAACAVLQLGGCNGGSSSEADNPLSMQVREGGKDVSFTGFAEFYLKGSNPEFFTPSPDDGTTPPRFVPRAEGGATWIVNGESVISIDRDVLYSQLMFANPSVSLHKKSAAASSPVPASDFNAILFGVDGKAGWLPGIHPDSIGHFRLSDGSGGDTLPIGIAPEREYAGTVDTATEAGPAVALFVPGTPYYAQVRGNAFRFQGIPEGKLPLRWVSGNGIIFDMEDSLGEDWSGPLRPGTRQDSVYLPPPVPTVAAPIAEPPGRYAFADSLRVTLEAEPGARIYYTLDGTIPDPASKPYAGSLLLRSSATLIAVAYIKGRNHSPITVNNYLLVPAAPIAAPAGKTFRDSLVVVLTASRTDASIRYTLDGSDPASEKASVYGEPLVLKATTTLKAVANAPGLGLGLLLEEKYFLVTDSTAAEMD